MNILNKFLKQGLELGFDVLDEMPVAIAAAEPETGHLCYVNQQALKLFGYKGRELIGQHQTVLHPKNTDDVNTFKQHLKALENNEVITLDNHIVRGDGKIIPVQITANMINWQNKTWMIGFFHSIEKRMAALEQLERQRQEVTAMFENSQVGIFQVDENRIIERCNQTMAAMLGAASPEDIIGLSVKSFHVSEESYKEFGEHYFYSLTQQKSIHVEYQFRKFTGEIFWARLSGKAIDNSVPADLSKGVIWVIDDITDSKAVEQALRAERNLFAGGPTVILQWKPLDGWPIVYASKNVENLLGYTQEEIQASDFSFEKLIHPQDYDRVKTEVEENIFDQYHNFEQSYRLKTKSGHYRNFYDYSQVEYHKNGEVKSLYGYFVDMTDYFKAQEFSNLLLNSANEGIFGIDLKGVTTFVNPAALNMLGYQEEELVGKVNHELIHHTYPSGQEIPVSECKMVMPIRTGEDYHVTDEVLWRKDDSSFPVEYWSTPIQKDCEIIGSVITFRDISEVIEQKERISRLSYHDPLTGLPNRRMFLDSLTEELTKERDSTHRAVILYLDLDHFKEINDSLGHPIGDQLLLRVVNRVRRILRDNDVFARMGGDEFAILLNQETGGIEASNVAEKIIKSFHSAFEIGEHQVKTSTSIGIVFCDPTLSCNSIISQADTALYEAKNSGRNAYVFYEPSMLDKVHQDMVLFNSLTHAIQNNEFELHYQLQFDAMTLEPVGAEALVRWPRAPESVNPNNVPSVFIPVAESRNLIQDLCLWEIGEVERDLPILRQAGFESRISINLSGKQLNHAEALIELQQVIQDSSLEFKELEFEITETAYAKLSNEARLLLEQFKSNGANIALDDFGTGYSSLASLRQFKSTHLKIDKQFIEHVHTNEDDYAIVAATISMAKALDKKVIAEGVEQEVQLQTLRELGCDIIQGYFLARPVALEDVCERLKSTPQT